MDVFHKNPAHQKRLIGSLTGSYETDIRVGIRKFHLIASVAKDASGHRLGTVVEWKDTTAEKAVEEEINSVVKGAASGDLTQRLASEGRVGFVLNLSNAMNDLCDTFSNFIAEVKNSAR